MSKEYSDSIKLLTSVGKFHISLGLERMEQILSLLNNPQDKLDCIHVAGTNGKGSVCSILASVLVQAGKKVGLYTSPHLFKYTERIQICGVSISDEDFSRYVFEISDLADKNEIDLTEFEILTAVMFKYFADKNVDVVILETGLGGRFDATNVIKKNLCSIITHVDFDHTERLGDTLDKIAYEKAGIIKPNCPCIVCEGREVYYDVCDEIGSLLTVVSPSVSVENFALKGVHQQENLSLALTALRMLFPDISQAVIDDGLKKVCHPGRFQYIKEKNLIIDGAHNPNGICALKQSLDMYFPDMPRRFIFGCLKNKDYETMLNNLFEPGDTVYFYHFNHANSCTAVNLRAVCPVESKEFLQNSRIEFNDDKLTVICGSLYMISELVELFGLDSFMH
ncbi:MAG: bifunctional folylpolyglutamate synthase/dihydrofolate synthase [Muribaculaceae bacterium]|nr:bifunctional folylpolyglutamate synthase/dihydrofolate synthase [Muribaculaceae bacterium]